MPAAAPRFIGDPNGQHEVCAGETAHLKFGCRAVVHGEATIFVEGGAACHAYDGAIVHLLTTDAYCCYDGVPTIDGRGRILKHRPGLMCI